MNNIIKKFKKNYLIIFFLLSLSLLWTIYTYNDKIQYKAIKKVEHNNFNIEKKYPEIVDLKIKDVNINFSLNVDENSKEGTIFNFGTEANPLILRLVKPSILQIVIGHDNPFGNKVYSLTGLLEYGRTYNIKIKVFKQKQLWVMLDDAVVINVYDKKFNFKISQVFINKNPDISMSNIDIKYALYNKLKLIIIIKYLLFLITIILGIKLFLNNFKTVTRQKGIRDIAFIFLIGFLMAVFYMVGQNILGYAYPKNTFLFMPGNMFGDFIYPVDRPNLITYSFFTTVIKRLFYFIGTETSLTLYIAGSLLFIVIINIKEIVANEKISKSSIINVIIFSLLSYPVLFSFNRGNLEILVFFLLYLFTYYLNKKNFIVSAVFLSIAISMKLFPAIFLIIFLSYKKFRALLYACLLTLFINTASLAVLAYQSFNVIKSMISEYLSSYSGPYIREYAIDNRGLDFGHSLYGLLKLRIFRWYKSTSITDISLKKVTELFNSYAKIEIAAFAIISSYVIFVEKELWKKITLLIIAMNLLPYISADYKLIHFFIPLYLFINKKERSKTDIVYIILFSLLLIPKNYYGGLLNLPDVSFAIFLNPVLMIILATFIMLEGLKNYYIKNYSK